MGNNLFHCLQVSVGATSARAVFAGFCRCATSARAVFPVGFQNPITYTTREELNWAVF